MAFSNGGLFMQLDGRTWETFEYQQQLMPGQVTQVTYIIEESLVWVWLISRPSLDKP